MIRRHYLLLLALLLAATVTGCRTGKPDERAAYQIAPPVIGLDTGKAENSRFAPFVYATTQDASAGSTKPGLLSGIGTLFSTPTGIAHRQAVRLARAAVPRKLAKGAVYAPQARQVVAAYKPTAAVVLADSGATVTAIGKAKAPVAIGAGATATQAVEKPGFWGAVASGLSLWWLLIPAAYVGWRLYRSTIPFA